MNEFKVISLLLARRGDEIGATEGELIKTLGLEGQDGRERLYRLLHSYASAIEVFGFKIERNALDGHWFLACTNDLNDQARINPLQGRVRLASTLVAILIITICEEEIATIEKIRKIRNIKDVTLDLKELEMLGLIKVNDNKVSITEKVGYYIDIARFIKQFTDFVNDRYK